MRVTRLPRLIIAFCAVWLPAVLCAAQGGPPLSVLARKRITHLTKAEIGTVEGTSPIVLVQFYRADCRWCSRFSQEVLPVFRRLYVDSGRVSVSQVDLGPPSPFGRAVPVNGLPYTEPALIIGKRAEDEGIDIKGGLAEFANLELLEWLFNRTGLIWLDHTKDATEKAP